MKTTPKKTPKASRPGVESKKQRTNRPEPAERRQVAALPFRWTGSGAVQILLITSRETGRFLIPKGWPMKRLSDPDAAAREAYEEAGVVGKIQNQPIGDYVYWKRLESRFELLKVAVYPLEVHKQRGDWPEKGVRQCRWLSCADAAALVDEPGLVALLRQFEG